MTVPDNTHGGIDYPDPSTFTGKYLPDPTAWNGPAWLFEGSTPEQIKAMQQAAIDEANDLNAGIDPLARFPPLRRAGDRPS